MSEKFRPLEYSLETLAKRVKSIRIINIQGIRDITINVPLSGILRLHAPSEVGKSASLKPLEFIVTDSNRTKKYLASLVNVDAPFGRVILELYDGHYVAVHLDKEKVANSYYSIQYPDRRCEKLPYLGVPQKILDILGWYSTGEKGSNGDIDFSLNVRLKGQLPVIETSKRLNSEIFNIALNNEQLESTHKETKVKEKEVQILEEALLKMVNHFEYTLENLKVEDESQLEVELNTLNTLLTYDKCCEALDSHMTTLYNSINLKPSHVKAPTYARKDIESHEVLTHLSNNLSDILNLEKPKLVTGNAKVRNDISELTLINQLLNPLNTIISIEKPTVKSKLDSEILAGIGKLENVNFLMVLLDQLSMSKKPVMVKRDLVDVQSSMATMQTILSLEKSISSCILNKPKLVDAKNQIRAINLDKLQINLDYILSAKTELDTLNGIISKIQHEKSQYQCPTCGQYNGGSTEHEH